MNFFVFLIYFSAIQWHFSWFWLVISIWKAIKIFVNNSYFGPGLQGLMALHSQIPSFSNVNDDKKNTTERGAEFNRTHPLSWNHLKWKLFSSIITSAVPECAQVHSHLSIKVRIGATDISKSPPVHKPSMIDCFNKLVLPGRNLSFTQ